MTIRPPKSLSNHPSGGTKRPTGAEVLEAEMMGEQAFALGLAAKKMERALEEYAKSNRDPRRTQMAADAVHNFFIQREMVGLDNHDYVIEFYDIPSTVLARVGAVEKSV
jgi:hypothetical protein